MGPRLPMRIGEVTALPWNVICAPAPCGPATKKAFEPTDVLLRMLKYCVLPIVMSASAELRKRLS